MEYHSKENAASRQVQTPVTVLRMTLSEMERHIGKINHTDKQELQSIPDLFQRASDLITELEAAGSPISSEKVRFETLCGQFDQQKRNYIKKLGGMARYKNLSQAQDRPENAWWWHFDETITAENVLKRKRQLRNFALAVAAFAMIFVIYQLFLAPDEATRKMVQYESEAERAIMVGDYAGALQAIEVAIDAAPEEPRLVVIRGVLHDLLDEQDLAEVDYDIALDAYAYRSDLLVERSNVFLMAGMPERALVDAELATEIEPTSAYGWYLVGTANNNLDETITALKAFETAANLANQQELTELEGLARMQIAYIYSAGMQ